MFENELAWRDKDAIRQGLLKLWQVMQDCVDCGCRSEGFLPGGLKINVVHRCIIESYKPATKTMIRMKSWIGSISMHLRSMKKMLLVVSFQPFCIIVPDMLTAMMMVSSDFS